MEQQAWSPGYYADLAEASFRTARSFARSLLERTTREFHLSAASLYLRGHDGGPLRLKAQLGLDYRRYGSFQLPPETHPGRAITSGVVHVGEVFEADPEYRDKGQLRDRPDLRFLAAIPIGIDAAPLAFPVPDPLGALCVYADSLEAVEQAAQSIEGGSTFIARLYVASLERYMMELRAKTVERVAYSKDISSLIHRFLTLVGAELGYSGGGSLFLHDETDQTMHLVNSTEARSPGIRIEQVFIDPQLGLLEAEALRHVQTVVRRFDPPLGPSQDHLGAFRSEVENMVCAPIIRPSRDRPDGQEAFGVVRLVNLTTTFDERVETVDPCWEDLALVRFSAEMVSVLIHQMLRTQESEFRFERLMHGAQTALGSALHNLYYLEDQLENSDLDRYRRQVSDATAWTSELKHQLDSRFVGQHAANLQIRTVNLHRDVVSAIPRLVRRLAQSHEFEFTITDPFEARFHEIPPVAGHRDALNSVFRNLVDNAVKYRGRRASPLRVELSWALEDDLLHVDFADYGIGILEDDQERIFQDTFRGRNARSLVPQGLGRGLADCRRIMARLGGIELVSIGQPTTFRVWLRLAGGRK